MSAKRKLSEFGIYHIMNRGTGKQLIFEDDRDRRAFLNLLNDSLNNRQIKILCWCLMDNHYHLLLQGQMVDISLSMKEVCSRYAQRFNKKHERTGHLFQGVFLSEAINDETYLRTVIRYIHQNPVKGGLSSNCEYTWSSYLTYTTGQAPDLPCDTILISELFESSEEFELFHRQEQPESFDCSNTQILAVSDRVLGPGRAGKVKELDKQKRNAAIAKLKAAGLSVRQIQRITGIGRNIIQRAC